MLLLLLLLSGAESRHRRRRKKAGTQVVRTVEPLDDDEEPDSDDEVFTPVPVPTRTRRPPSRSPAPTTSPTPTPVVEEPPVRVSDMIRVARIRCITPPFVSANDPSPVVIEFDSTMPPESDAVLQIDGHRVVCARVSALEVQCNVTRHKPGEVFVSVDFGDGRVTEAYPLVYVGGIYLRAVQLVKGALAVIGVVVGVVGVFYLCLAGKRAKEKESGVPKDVPIGDNTSDTKRRRKP